MRCFGPIASVVACALLMGCAHGSPPLGAEQTFGVDRDLSRPMPRPDRKEFEDLFDRMRAGFALPAVENFRIRREIDWYVAHTAFLDRSFDRGRRYLHHIVEELEARNMPGELALLPVVESAFDPFALSPCLASGLWQFIPSTGQRYGLDQDWWLDERRDVRAATRAALDHLAELHDEFEGDWLLALAAYNTGEANVKRAIERNLQRGLPVDYFHLELRPETLSYVPRLLAIARVAAEPERFGIVLPSIPNVPYFARVDAGGQVDLGLVANLAGIPLAELRALNPQYNRFATAPHGPYDLLVPTAAEPRFQQVLATLPPSKRLRFAHHRVRRGDTLFAIATRYGVSVEALRAINDVRGSRIHPGQDLLVPLSHGSLAAAEGAPARERGALASRTRALPQSDTGDWQ